MIKIGNNEPVVIEIGDYRIEFANIDTVLRLRTDLEMTRCAQRIYDKKNGVYVKDRFVGADAANAILNFALGV